MHERAANQLMIGLLLDLNDITLTFQNHTTATK